MVAGAISGAYYYYLRNKTIEELRSAPSLSLFIKSHLQEEFSQLFMFAVFNIPSAILSLAFLYVNPSFFNEINAPEKKIKEVVEVKKPNRSSIKRKREERRTREPIEETYVQDLTQFLREAPDCENLDS